MCLYTKQIMPIRARKDITVYKKVYFNKYSKTYTTPWMGITIPMRGTLHAAERYIRIVHKHPYHQGRGLYTVTRGFIHCFTTLEYAVSHLMGTNDRIVKCTIKKGTLYYKSHDGREICAKSIEIGNIVAYRYNTKVQYIKP